MFFQSKVYTFDNKNVLITGCSKGIGHELALQIGTLTKAKNLIIIARSVDKLKELQSEIKLKNPNINVFVEQCDVGNIDAMNEMLKDVESKVPVIDIIINDAASIDFTLFDKSEWNNLLQEIHVNILGVTYLLHHFIPKMVARRSGGVINIGSAAGLWIYPGSAVYNGSKHYIRGFTDCLKLDLVGTGVFVTEVVPGPVKTEGWDGAGELMDSKTWIDVLMRNFPLLAMISASQCASDIISGYEHGRANIVPGWLFSIGMLTYNFIPTSVVRLIGTILSPKFRQHEREAHPSINAPPSAKKSQ